MLTRFNHHYFELVWEMTLKEFVSRYKQAVFGFAWLILNPLLQMIIMGVVFSNFVNIPNYFAFLFSGLLPWQFFSLTISKATNCFVNERALLQKTYFSREIIPLSQIFANALNFCLSLLLFVLFLVIFSSFVQIKLLILLVGIIWLISFTVGFSLLTSSLNVRYRDVSFFVQTLSIVWFYATPIIYSFSQLPDHLQQLLKFNPLSAPITLIQFSLVSQTPPPLDMVLSNLIITIIISLIGFFVFIKESPYFTDWL